MNGFGSDVVSFYLALITDGTVDYGPTHPWPLHPNEPVLEPAGGEAIVGEWVGQRRWLATGYTGPLAHKRSKDLLPRGHS